ncbi:hypothetical protein A2773_01955 [Candidatus Gottesmanbacteria bacterium RIFCSPHIGHO2_01_FULL_39_10]|uniref:Peptidase M48 domain-containing protein n=1 Tax=Candidatus Gottesmanbacteria bacterium RIFCSPHIGHO2_01_FULL_39_10 TaxID=1798375 RepID=A0A1F5ZLH7_9BACT|nr:MAG: hypothetical protein A2773_01955 [Candidatus Gottesmanbacteria bacterium RIFCSPHIGHO2_01_FULL_39_10]
MFNPFVLYLFLFLFIANRGIIYAFIEGIFNRSTKKNKTKDITDKKILDLIYKKTGLKLSKILLFDTSKVWAMMAGFPPKPYMIISNEAYKNLDKDEMEWIYLHEAGHYILWHNLKMALLQLLFIFPGLIMPIIIKSYILQIIGSIILAILSSILYFYLARLFEYEASYYAMRRMTNPQAISTLALKAQKRWFDKVKHEKFHKLFNTWIYDIYENLVQAAKKEITSRK